MHGPASIIHPSKEARFAPMAACSQGNLCFCEWCWRFTRISFLWPLLSVSSWKQFIEIGQDAICFEMYYQRSRHKLVRNKIFHEIHRLFFIFATLLLEEFRKRLDSKTEMSMIPADLLIRKTNAYKLAVKIGHRWSRVLLLLLIINSIAVWLSALASSILIPCKRPLTA